MRMFEIAGDFVEERSENFTARLAVAYEKKLRPLCLCRNPGVPMYVARIGDQHVVKRMPLSGRTHGPQCES